jgi:hypothetical protein
MVWNQLLDGKSVNADTVDKQKALNTYMMYIFAKEFGWTPDETYSMSANLYEDFVRIIGLKGSKEKKNTERQKRQLKAKKR